MKWLLTFVAVGALALPAAAQDWTRAPSGSQTTNTTSMIRAGAATAFWDTTAASGQTARLAVDTNCSWVSYWLNPDSAGANTGAEVQAYNCEDTSFDTDTCHKLLVDTDGDGVRDDVTLDGTTIMRIGQEQVTGINNLFFDIVANAGGDDARISVVGVCPAD